jgi:hypothetical protein
VSGHAEHQPRAPGQRHQSDREQSPKSHVISATSSAMPPITSISPTQLNGITCSAVAASSRQIAPSARNDQARFCSST